MHVRSLERGTVGRGSEATRRGALRVWLCGEVPALCALLAVLAELVGINDPQPVNASAARQSPVSFEIFPWVIPREDYGNLVNTKVTRSLNRQLGRFYGKAPRRGGDQPEASSPVGSSSATCSHSSIFTPLGSSTQANLP